MSDNSENTTQETEVKAAKPKFSFRTQISNLSYGGVTLLFTMIFTFVVVLAACIAVFFATVQGKEKVMVPNVVGKPFTTAVFEMQEKELYPKLIMHYSDLPGEAGLVLAQDPEPGAIVKAYRRVTLTVSRGVALTRVDDYVGKNVDAVKSAIDLEFSGERPLLSVADITFQKDPAPMGTILAQYPAADTNLFEPVQMHFVVSSGLSYVMTDIPDIKGKSIEQILADYNTYRIIYDFTAHIASEKETGGTVTAISYPEEKTVPRYTRVNAEIALSDRKEGDQLIQGLFEADLIDYPYPVPMRLETSDLEGKVVVLASFLHPGKHITLPYEIKPESTLTLYVMDEPVSQIYIH